jgi:TetR/AcrR family transcriptional repressor of nem operon
MGVLKEKASRNRAAILKTASRVFRERGVSGVGVVDLMKEAGFTHGGFYNHFPSKDVLAAEACAAAFSDTNRNLKDAATAGAKEKFTALRAWAGEFLSAQHRDTLGQGCPSASLVADATHLGGALQASYTAGLTGMISAVARQFEEPGRSEISQEAREKACTLVAQLVGAIVLARGVGASDPALSDLLLASVRKQLPI